MRWAWVEGYAGHYVVSDTGLVVSTKFGKHRLLRQGDSGGYAMVRLALRGSVANHKVHRLVAQAFVHRPDGCDIVNHLDSDKRNNHFTNLEWTTPKGNSQHAVAIVDKGLRRKPGARKGTRAIEFQVF